jgi:hypothetical protein
MLYRILWLLYFGLLVPLASAQFASDATHVALGWNELGMHCMNGDFSSLCILPPFNTLMVQVVQRGDPPALVSSGVNLTYRFPENSKSSTKVNFWQYANQLFGVTLANDVGLTGKGITGTLDWNASLGLWEAPGTPLTPFTDAAPTTEQPYQFAEVTVHNALGSQILDQTTFVAPVSVEMHCDKCHSGGGRSVYVNILRKHDEEEGTNLQNSQPVLCASCHSDNALGAAGKPGIPSLSQAIHSKHAEEASQIGCYDCHPGQQTQCLRDAMFKAGKTCTDCHGSISNVGRTIRQGRRPWLDEPECADCHDAEHSENTNTLYRFSKGHGGLYCTACHNSPHAILPTVQPRDAVQMLRVQGTADYAKQCMICHTSQPLGPGPHNIVTSYRIARQLKGFGGLSTEELTRADYNQDGKLDVADVVHQVNRGL